MDIEKPVIDGLYNIGVMQYAMATVAASCCGHDEITHLECVTDQNKITEVQICGTVQSDGTIPSVLMFDKLCVALVANIGLFEPIPTYYGYNYNKDGMLVIEDGTLRRWSNCNILVLNEPSWQRHVETVSIRDYCRSIGIHRDDVEAMLDVGYGTAQSKWNR